MHDIDRTYQEMEEEQVTFQEEVEPEALWGEVLDESEVDELAAELLEVASDQELDQFIGRWLKKASRAVGAALRSPIGQQLGGALKGVVRKALPVAGGMLGGAIGGPLGAALGGKAASMAGSMFGLELEGLSSEDREFEVARQLVRLGADATRRSLTARQSANITRTVSNAVQKAVQQYAPGLAASATRAAADDARSAANATRAAADDARSAANATRTAADIPGQSGRWVRRGNRIILLGLGS